MLLTTNLHITFSKQYDSIQGEGEFKKKTHITNAVNLVMVDIYNIIINIIYNIIIAGYSNMRIDMYMIILQLKYLNTTCDYSSKHWSKGDYIPHN